MSEPNNTPKEPKLDLSSLYVDNREQVATTFNIAGFRFFLRSWSEEARIRNHTTAERLAAFFGMTVEEADEAQFKASHAARIMEFQEADRAFYITDCVMGIGRQNTGPADMETIAPELVLRMRADIVVPLVQFIVEFNRDGVGETEFFRHRNR